MSEHHRRARPSPASAGGGTQQKKMSEHRHRARPSPASAGGGTQQKKMSEHHRRARPSPASAGVGTQQKKMSEHHHRARPSHASAVIGAPERASLVIFVDWDDTLFPTSELLASAALRDSLEPQRTVLPPRLAKKVRSIERSAMEFLQAAQQKGTVVIVTNAAPGWIGRLTQWSMPRLGEFMTRHGIGVRYARDCGGAKRSDVTTWKMRTFVAEADAVRDRLSRPRPLSIVSVGDAMYEREAAHNILQAHPDDQITYACIISVVLGCFRRTL
jgi:hypothetical protein